MGVDLYKYYPTFVKLKDRLASGIEDADSRETVLAKLVYMLDQMFDDTDEFIQTLMSLNDPDSVDQQYFSHVSYLLGTILPNGASEEETRFIIKQLVNHYKTSGTHPSWQTAWHWLQQPDTKVVELFKRDQQEVANYSTTRSANHPLKSARVQLGSCSSSCESVCVNTCESACESIVEVGSEVPTQEALRRLGYVEYLRPIHVLLRQEAEEIVTRSGFPRSQDTIGHYPIVYNEEPDPWRGSEVQAEFRNPFFSSGDELDVEVQCVSICEVSCQSCCEAVCECDPCQVVCQTGGCELQCTANCQGFCEFACEAACQFACTACEAGACTAACAGACLGVCEGACESACQSFECQVGTCQGACESICQAHVCETGECQSSCETTVEVCDFACEGACQGFECQVNTCQNACIAAQCEAAQCTAGQCEAAQCTAGQCETAQCTAGQCETAQCTAGDCETAMCQASTCQDSCTDNTTQICGSACQGACTDTSCTSVDCQISTCQDSCTGVGTMVCGSVCQASCTTYACQGSACQAGGPCQASYCMILFQ
jgi:hypothetical protein